MCNRGPSRAYSACTRDPGEEAAILRAQTWRDDGRWTRTSLFAFVLAVVALASACSQRTEPVATGIGTPGIGEEAGAPVGSVAKDGAQPPASSSQEPGSSRHSDKVTEPSPNPFVTPFPADAIVLVDAVLTPVCANNGTVMTLVVETNSEAGVGYQAIYSDNGGGGPAPYGSGYGGNGKGLADKSGHFRSTWVISPSAPAGAARVDVVVGWRGKWGYESLTFHVGPQATCS